MMLCGTPSCRVSGVHGLGKRASGVDLSWETAMRESRNLQFMYIQYMNCVHMCSSCLLISRQKSLEYFQQVWQPFSAKNVLTLYKVKETLPCLVDLNLQISKVFCVLKFNQP